MWDDRLLAEQLKGLSSLDLDFDLEATGFTIGELICASKACRAKRSQDDPAD